jgi:hypothetical protein
MANPSLTAEEVQRLQKPARGSGLLAREAAKAAERTAEDKAIKAAKVRDGHRCRWPEDHTCRGLLEGAHIVDKSLGGANEASNIVSLCAWLHRRGPESVHGKQLKVEADTDRGAYGPLSFWRQTGEYDALGQPLYYLVGREDGRGGVVRD